MLTALAGRGYKRQQFCGRHKWMTQGQIASTAAAVMIIFHFINLFVSPNALQDG